MYFAMCLCQRRLAIRLLKSEDRDLILFFLRLQMWDYKQATHP